MTDRHYLELLAKDYPTVDAASAEIINLSAICELPKGTEYFFSDIHGEADAFSYLLGTASGVIRGKIEALFVNSVPEPERAALSDLIYQPKEFLESSELACDASWCRVVIYRLVQVCKSVTSKYTRSKVRKKMPAQFGYILDELLHADTEENKEEYYSGIISSIVDLGTAETFIITLCRLIRRCCVDCLHVIGDIFDRGPHADYVMEELMRCENVDIQWGNHDIHWMGAAAGNLTCMANVVRAGISYNNFDLLEEGYGINLRPLSAFAASVYRDDPCEVFRPHLLDENIYDPIDADMAAKMHKAIAVIQFKLEGQLIARHPEYNMQNRAVLARVDFAKGDVEVGGKRYALRDTLFPTVDPKDPLALSPGEAELMGALARSFENSRQLARHIPYLYNNGGIYKIANGNLLYHGCIPMTKNGAFDKVELFGKVLSGRAYMDAVDELVRDAYYAPEGSPERRNAQDFMWYLWCGAKSPLFGKSQMTTFERYFIADKATHAEEANPYFKLIAKREICEKILEEFGLSPAASHIVNGHVPVAEGDSPQRGGGLLYVIDGGISKAYHSKTGIGGYTLISNSHHLALAEHRPFAEARKRGMCGAADIQVVELYPKRVTVKDTDTGCELTRRIGELKDLLAAYRDGDIREKRAAKR